MKRKTKSNPMMLSLAVFLSACPAIGQVLNEDLKIIAAEVEMEDYFGQAVDISGTTAIVGAPSTFTDFRNLGYAYLYDLETGEELFQLVASDAWGSEWFGSSVAITSDRVVVGAPYERNGIGSSGAAYIFDTNTGKQLFKIFHSDNTSSSGFGWSLDISGDRVISGAPFTTIPSGVNSGAAYVFDVTTGEQLLRLIPSDPIPFGWFGESVAICDNIAVVGASQIEEIGPNSGAAYVFDLTTGEELFKLVPADTSALSNFGYSAAISGNIAIISAVVDDEIAVNSGAAYLFDVTTGEQLFKLSATDIEARDQFGWDVDITGTTAIVGSVFDNHAGDSSGSAYIFDIATGQQLYKLTASDADQGDRFGSGVALSGSTALVGSPRDNDSGTNSGSAHLFELGVENACRADFNADGMLDFFDISIFLAAYSCLDPIADLTDDNEHDFFDISAYLQLYTTGCP